MAGDAKANINENIKKANIDYLKSTTFIKYYLPFFKLGLNADELHTLNLIFSFEADNKIYIGSSKYLITTSNTALATTSTTWNSATAFTNSSTS